MLRRVPRLLGMLERDQIGSAFDLNFYDGSISEYAKHSPRPFPIHELIGWYDSGQITGEHVVESAGILYTELPLRLAKTLGSFENLPLIVLKQPGMLLSFKEYRNSFDALANHPPPTTLETALDYTSLIETQLQRNANLLSALSEGVTTSKQYMTGEEIQRLDEFIHLFIGHRLARRLLGSNHQAVVDHYREGFSPQEVGIFHRAAPVKFIVEAATEEAQDLCGAEYGQFPEISVSGDVEATLFCVPANLQAILVELLKNSMKATVERHNMAPILPQIEAAIHTSTEGTVLIVLADQGGGMSSESEASLWRYGVSGTTLLDKKGRRKVQNQALDLGVRDVVSAKRLSGYGFGLPLSKARANYFGGELWIQNMEGHGIDTYVKMIPAPQRWAKRYSWDA